MWNKEWNSWISNIAIHCKTKDIHVKCLLHGETEKHGYITVNCCITLSMKKDQNIIHLEDLIIGGKNITPTYVTEGEKGS